MMLEYTFQTERLEVAHWNALLDDPDARQILINDLRPILTPIVLAPLPPSLGLSDASDAIDTWIAERAGESDVHTVRTASGLIGLMILACFNQPNIPVTIHLGYLFGQEAWGNGFASEMMRGFIDAIRSKGTPTVLLAGVNTDNHASVRLLQKFGFERIRTLETSDHHNYRLEL